MAESETKATFVKCRVCGSVIGPAKLVAKVQETAKLPAELAETCARCRRAGFMQELEKCLTAD